MIARIRIRRMRSAMRPVIIPAFAALVLLISSLSAASAAGQLSVGVSPAELSFDNLYVDGYGRRELLVSTASEEEVSVSFSIESSPYQGWLTVKPSQKIIRLGEPVRLALVAEPEDAAPGEYLLYLAVGASAASGATAGGAASTVQQTLRVPVSLEVTGEADLRCQAAASLSPAEENHEMLLSLTVGNTGNVRAAPDCTVDLVSDDDEMLASHSFTLPALLPGEQTRYRESFAHGLSAGEYWALVSLPACSYYKSLQVSVVEEVRRSAELTAVGTAADASVGGILPLNATLRNPHHRAVDSVVVIELLHEKGGEVLRSERMRLGPDESASVMLYFRPGHAGRYRVRAYSESAEAGGARLQGQGKVIEQVIMVRAGFDAARLKRLAFLFLVFLGAGLVLLRLIRLEHMKKKG